MTPQERAAREFVRAFNERDLDAFAAVVAPGVEMHSMGGLRVGREEARGWATRAPGGVQQTILIDRAETAGDRVLLEIRRDWVWDEDGTHAGTEEMAWLFTVEDDLVTWWRPFDDRTEARIAFDA